jgi:hypothetical protein
LSNGGPSDGLAILGLRPGETVRWRSAEGARWHTGKVARRERDGSIGVTDARGASRSLPVGRLEVRCSGPRGGPAWEPLGVRAARCEQLRLL